MTDNQQRSALNPIPSPAAAGEGRVVTELRTPEITADALVRASLRLGGEISA